jgi:hypothetical protein
VKESSAFNSMGSFSSCPMRILGPGRSAMMVTRFLATMDAARIFWMVSPWLAKSPWEKLSRATFIPAWIILSKTAGEFDAGPMVQTILVLLAGKGMAFPLTELLKIDYLLKAIVVLKIKFL